METIEKKKKKRSQYDYNLGFKLSVVEQVERGEMTYKQAQRKHGIQGRSTVLVWLRKYGVLDWGKREKYRVTSQKIKETPAEKIKRLEKELGDERLRNDILSKMIEISDREYGTEIKKKYFSEQLENFKSKNK